MLTLSRLLTQMEQAPSNVGGFSPQIHTKHTARSYNNTGDDEIHVYINEKQYITHINMMVTHYNPESFQQTICDETSALSDFLNIELSQDQYRKCYTAYQILSKQSLSQNNKNTMFNSLNILDRTTFHYRQHQYLFATIAHTATPNVPLITQAILNGVNRNILQDLKEKPIPQSWLKKIIEMNETENSLIEYKQFPIYIKMFNKSNLN